MICFFFQRFCSYGAIWCNWQLAQVLVFSDSLFILPKILILRSRIYETFSGLISATYYDMGLYEFIALNVNEKVDAVWNQATYLMSRKTETGSVNLYALEDFYVEVYYDQELNSIEDIRSFKSVHCLEPYLDVIELKKLLEN